MRTRRGTSYARRKSAAGSKKDTKAPQDKKDKRDTEAPRSMKDPKDAHARETRGLTGLTGPTGLTGITGLTDRSGPPTGAQEAQGGAANAEST
jgi:hypothetical protein